MTRPRLGDLLVSTGQLAPAQLEAALLRQKDTGRRLGETLIELGYVAEEVVAQVLSQQLSVPWVSLGRVDFSRELLNLVSAELASKWMLVPIYARRSRQGVQTLFVAIDDPLNDRALAEVAAHVGMAVKPMVASTSELRSVIRIYYGVEMPALVQRALADPSMPPIEVDIEFDPSQPEFALPAESGATSKSSRPRSEKPRSEKPRSERPRSERPRSEKPQKGSSQIPKSRPKVVTVPPAAALPKELAPLPLTERSRKKKPRMLTLTLLDGTTVTLPAATKGPSAPPDERLTTRDLILALDARAQGKDVKSVLAGASWESLFATLLSLLMRKGLLADWEFVEEWEKHPHGAAEKA
jgi:type IV pilus assembly protein PilB